MRLLRDLPIHRKLISMMMLTSVAALALACGIFIAYEQLTFRAAMVREYAILADLFGPNLAPGLTFNDPGSLTKMLKTLSAHPRVVAAAVYDEDGKRVATYERTQSAGPFPWPMPSAEVGSRFQAERLDNFQPIILTGETIGTFYLAADLSELTERRVRYAQIGSLALLLSGLVAYWFAQRLQRVISVPVSDLAETASQVAFEQNYSLRAVKHGPDELGHLVDQFNAMLTRIQLQAGALQDANLNLERRVAERTGELQAESAGHQRAREELTEAQERLVATSRQAGMAEVATSVLHNVGNVLNSVSVSAEVVGGKVRQMRAGGLKSAAQLLQEHAHDLPAFLTHDPRGRELPAYLIQLAGQLGEPQQGILQELERLRKNLDHIKEIVAMQQSHARGSGVWETLSVAELVEDALRINAAGFDRHQVRLVQEFSPVPPLVTDRHKVLQILVNLVSNAKYAVSGMDGDKRLLVRVSGSVKVGVKIEVMDNGVGIAPENLNRIFQHGFTTRRDGHGFGLHSGALAAKELGGRLTVQSEGLGRGAAFTLELPPQHPKEGV